MGIRLVDPGNIVHASDQGSIAILTQTQPATVLFTLPAQTLDGVRAAMARGAVAVDAYDRDNLHLLSHGTLATVDNLIDQATATYRLKAMFANQDEKLWPGEFVNARLLLETRQNVVVIPPWPCSAARTDCSPGLSNPTRRWSRDRSRPGDHRQPHHLTSGVSDVNRSSRRPVQAPDRRPGHCHQPHAAASRGSYVSISEPFIRRPVATTLLMAALAFVGIVSFPFLPVAPLPQVDFPTIQISTTWAGASAETMATSVAAPLEQQFGQIAGVTQMTSQSTQGASTIVIQFDLNRNIDSAAQDVQAAITVATKTLPQSLTTPPAYKKVNPADVAVVLFSVHSDTMPLTTVDEYANVFLAQQISQVSGVAQVLVFGDRAPSIRIQVDPAKLAATGSRWKKFAARCLSSPPTRPKA